MFDNGDKVVVVGSTVKKSKTGPKKGSMGYVLSCNLMHSIYSKSLHAIKQIYRVKVLFVRYGFEKKHRFEIKTVISTMTGTDANISEKEFIKAMSLDVNEQDTKDPIVDRLKKDKMPMCTLVPADICSNRNLYNDAELTGWIVSIMLYDDVIMSDIAFAENGLPINEAIDLGIVRALLSTKSSNISDMVNKIMILLLSMSSLEKQRIVKSLTLIRCLSLNRETKYIEENIVEDIANLYQEGCGIEDILIELRTHLLLQSYTNRYWYIEGVTLSSLYEMNRVYYDGGENNLSRHHKVFQSINNTRNTARGLGCLFSRSLG